LAGLLKKIKKRIKLFETLDHAKSFVAGKKGKIIERNGRKFLVLLDENDHIIVSDIKCPHQKLPMEGAVCQKGKLICPYHQYAFDIKTGRGGGLYLEFYPVIIDENGVWIEWTETRLRCF
jgi:nitrite reductase/ring-hydroxylating ferredoxin subunit